MSLVLAVETLTSAIVQIECKCTAVGGDCPHAMSLLQFFGCLRHFDSDCMVRTLLMTLLKEQETKQKGPVVISLPKWTDPTIAINCIQQAGKPKSFKQAVAYVKTAAWLGTISKALIVYIFNTVIHGEMVEDHLSSMQTYAIMNGNEQVIVPLRTEFEGTNLFVDLKDITYFRRKDEALVRAEDTWAEIYNDLCFLLDIARQTGARVNKARFLNRATLPVFFKYMRKDTANWSDEEVMECCY